MTRPRTRDLERKWVKDMIERLPLEVGSVVDGADPPDFWLTLVDGRRIVLEVTQALDERIAAGAGSRDRLRKQVREGLAVAGVCALVTISLDEGAAVALRDARAVASEAVAIVALVRSAPCAPTYAMRHKFERFDEFEGETGWCDSPRDARSHVSDLNGRDVAYASAIGIWPSTKLTVAMGGLGDSQHAGLIQEAINKKAQKLEGYRQLGGDETWLLVVGSSYTGGALDISDAEENVYTSPFDRTIFLECFGGECVDIAVG